ncbi:Sialic acid transporter NanT [Castellaniella defragrans]
MDAQLNSAQGGGSSDVVSPYAWKALWGSAIGYAMDGFDLLILGFMLAGISADLHLAPGQAGALVTWTLVGAVCGGIVFGSLSDHYGRVRVLTWSILLFAVFTGLCAVAQGYWDLLAYRTIAGIGLGGEFGIGMALAAEAWPASQRARVSSYGFGLAGGRAARRHRHSIPVAAHRLARHVPGGDFPGSGRLGHPAPSS